MNPDSTVDFFVQAAKEKHQDRLDQAKDIAANIKRWFEIVDEENTRDGVTTCSRGDENLEVFKQKMYEISREI